MELGINTQGGATMYFGPLAGYDTEELDRRGLDQNKKTTKGFKWTAAKKKITAYQISSGRVEANQGPPPKIPETVEDEPHDIPTWNDFTQTTTFHGVRYIFDRTPFRMRR